MNDLDNAIAAENREAWAKTIWEYIAPCTNKKGKKTV